MSFVLSDNSPELTIPKRRRRRTSPRQPVFNSEAPSLGPPVSVEPIQELYWKFRLDLDLHTQAKKMIGSALFMKEKNESENDD